MLERLLSRITLADGATTLERIIAGESVKLRTRQSIDSGPVISVAALAIGLLLTVYGRVGWPILAWSASVIAAAWLTRRFCKRLLAIDGRASADSIAQAQAHVLKLTLLNATIVALGIWLAKAGGATTEISFLLTVAQVLYSLGALINASTHPPTFIVGAMINLGSLIIFWGSSGGIDFVPAVGVAGLLILMQRIGRQLGRDFQKTTCVAYENAELLERLKAETEAANRAMRAAEHANMAKSRFLAAASHDLRQPLHTLMLFAGLLERGGGEHRRSFIEHIQSAAATLDHLFNGLLDLSKIDAGSIKTNIEPLRARDLILPIADEVAGAAAAKCLTIKVDLADDIVVLTDRFLFERIARNLLDNAIKYTESGGVIVYSRASGANVELCFEDTGVGIAPEHQAHVFEEFFQVGNPQRDARRGSGLGLAIVSRLCSFLGHRIELQSRLGSGSTFRIELCRGVIIDTAEPASTITDESTVDDHSSTLDRDILVFEDDPSGAAAMRATLMSWGCRPLMVSSLEEFNALIAAQPDTAIDLVLADFRLPGGFSGLDAIKRVRALVGYRPAAIITGDVERFGEDNAVGDIPVFKKPVTEAVLRRWAEAALDHRSTTD